MLEGQLKEYVRRRQPDKRQEDVGASGTKLLEKQPITRVIHMTTGAIEKWTQSKTKRKQHLKSVMTIEDRPRGLRKMKVGRSSFPPRYRYSGR